MKRLLCLITLGIFSIVSAGALAQATPQRPSPPPFAPDRVLVKFVPGTAASAIADAHRRVGGRTLKIIPGIDVHVVEVPAGTVLAHVALYKSNPNVKYAEPDYYRLLAIPSEEPGPTPAGGANYFEEQWYHNNTGQWHTYKRTSLLGETLATIKGVADADIDSPEAWDVTQGRTTTDPADPTTPKIAVLDSGADCNALELASKCLEQVNVVGPQFWDGGDDDAVGHGTFVAAEAAADTNNGEGIAGAGWNTSFGAFKVCYLELLTDGLNYFFVGLCPVSASAAGIVMASNDQTNAGGDITRSQYHVITMSYASDLIDPETGIIYQTDPSTAECEAVQYAWEKGLVVVAAAGNNGDTNKVYPAACTHSQTGEPLVISVSASDDSDNRASFSSYSNDSDDWVSIAAPGEWILGVLPDASCGLEPGVDTCVDWWNGTSMAAPLVAGAASLVWSHLYDVGVDGQDGVNDAQDMTPANCTADGRACNEVVRERLETGADKTGAQGQNLLAWTRNGRLNVANAVGNTQPGNQPPTASFTYSCIELSCSFTDTSSDDSGVVSWSWNFGDGYSSINQNVSHTYDGEGDYTVTLTVSDAQGLTDAFSATVTVATTSNTPPTAVFSSSCSNLNCAFTDESVDPGGSIAGWAWDFGDGNTSDQQNPSHSYAAPGDYVVKLIVTDNQGATDTASKTVSVSAPSGQNQPPSAAFSYSCTTTNCSFDAGSSSDPEGPIDTYTWDFGDFVVQQTPDSSIAHAYAGPGTYTVSLTVTDAGGRSSAPASVTVTVKDKGKTSGSTGTGGDTGGGGKGSCKKNGTC